MATTSSGPADRADQELRRIALAYPGTSEHFPWGHRTIKVRDKAFVFMGVEDGGFFFTTKLPDSRHVALLLPFAEPTGYGLGKSGWVTARFARGSQPPVEMLAGWLDESFRAVAPKKVVATLPASGPPGGAAVTVPTAAKQATAKKPAAAKKATAKKPAAKKKPTAATKATAKKPAAKKKPAAATKATAKKPAAKKQLAARTARRPSRS
jgi:predicted DNA-binding protein (MmcQ/YjbR family)